MYSAIKPVAFATLLGLACTTALADTDTALTQLRKQIQDGNRAAAWQQAQQMRAQWESDPGFDYLYGVLALDQQQYSEAQFALERAIQHDPANPQARLALAKTYLKLGDSHSARRQLEAVKQSAPPTHVMRDVNHYLAGIGGERSGSWGGFVEANIGHDNNVAASTNRDNIPNPDYDPLNFFSSPTLTLDPEASQQSDMYSHLQAGLDYYRPLDTNTGMELSGRIMGRNNFSTGRYDTGHYRGSASLITLAGKNQWRGTVTTQENRLSDSDYQSYYSLSGDWSRAVDNQVTLFAALFLNELRYDDHLRDIYQQVASFGFQRQQGRVLQGAGVLIGDENAQQDEGDHNARFFGAVYYDARFQLAYRHQLFGKLYWQQSHQNAQEPFFGEVRNDDLQQISAGWDWQLALPLRLRTELVYQNNDSSEDYYSYERTRLQTGLRYSF